MKLGQFSLDSAADSYTATICFFFSVQMAFAVRTEFFFCFCSMFSLFFVEMISQSSCKLLERVPRNRPELKHKQICSASVLVSAVSLVSCRLTRKTVKKNRNWNLKISMRMACCSFGCFQCAFARVVDVCVCVCVSMCGCKVG